VFRGLKRRLGWALLGIFLIFQILAQLFYPSYLTLPLARYNREPYGLKHRDDMVMMEQSKFVSTRLELTGSYGKEQVDLIKLGGRLDESANFNNLSYYPKKWRWVPFSILFWRPDVLTLPITFDDKPLLNYTLNYSKKHSKKATDASISIRDGNISIKDGKKGLSVDANKLRLAIKNKYIDTSGIVRLDVPEASIEPSASSADLLHVRQQAEDIISKHIVVSVAGRQEEFIPSKEQLASWLRVVEESGKVKLDVDSQVFGDFIDAMDKLVAKPAGQTIVSVVDDREVLRQEGVTGERVNRLDFEQKMSSILFRPGVYKYISIDLEPIMPEVKTSYSFSHTQAGLQAKLREIGRRYDTRISLQQLNGEGWGASYRGTESIPSASTYKLYIALRLFDEIKSGRLNWQSSVLGTTVDGCFHQMIVVSTNQCAEEWIRQFGRTALNSFLYERGISQATTFTAEGAIRTSSDDLLRTIIGINDGSLAGGYERDKLLDMMGRQIWRQGIPSGTQGWTANKVGFLWDYVHDTGIVHHPKGVYAISIMTKGANYGIIAKITRELEAQMYP
jgi:beta-lactamase class A